jgi:hypothetical protein
MSQLKERNMICRTLLAVCIGLLVVFEQCSSQGDATLPFLLIPPSAEMNGMGETSVAVFSDDPLAMITNPAQLGMQSLSTHVSSGYNYANWLPRFH